MKKVDSTFKITAWEEKPFSEYEGGYKLTKATVTKTYEGEMEGEGHLEYLMVYTSDQEAKIYGIERFVGKIEEREGSMVFEHFGTFAGGAVTTTQRIMEGGGTGALENLNGTIEFSAGHATEYPIQLCLV